MSATPPTSPAASPFEMPRTVGELVALFLGYLRNEEARGRTAPRTVSYYHDWLTRWVGDVGADLPLADVIAYHLERFKSGWHSMQTVKRCFKWAADVKLIASSPFARVKLPPKGQREKILTRAEMTGFLRAAEPEFRRFLLAMRQSIARPQEIRGLKWAELEVFDVGAAFVLSKFKGKDRRLDGVRLRIIPVDDRFLRLLKRLQARRGQLSLWDQGHVFLNSRGLPFTANAIRCCFRRLRTKLGMEAGEGEEAFVAYSFRHSAATLATAAGVRDRILADIMGHASTRTTARYQHLRPEDLAEAIKAATRKRRPPRAEGGRRKAEG